MKFKLLFIFIFTAFSICLSQETGLKFIGEFKNYTSDGNSIIITCTNAKVALTPYNNEIIRVRISQWEFGRNFSYAVTAAPDMKFKKVNDNTDKMVFETEKLKIVMNKNPLRFQFFNTDGILLNEDYKDFGIAWHGTEVTSYKKLFEDEKFIGLGEKIGNLNRRGNSYVNWNTDDYGYEVEADPLYVSIPFFIGIHSRISYGIFLDNSYKTTFNFGASTDDEFSSFSAEDGEMNYYFISGGSVSDIIKNYTYLTGRMKLPPIWSLGYQQCRWSYFPDSEVMDLANIFRHKQIPCDVIYLDIDYMDAYKIFTWHPERFSKPNEMIKKLNEMGFHISVIVDPGIKVEKNYFAYEDGIKNDYFVKYPGGKRYIGSVWPGRCHFPDFSDPKVRTWWGDCFSKLIEPGVEGFWNDMNEPACWGQSFPVMVEMNFDGMKSTMKEGHNIYGLEMSRATYEGTKKLLKGKRPFVLTRAAYSGIQRYSSIWTGDNVASEEHMMLACRLVNSLGLSGVPFVGADIGGFSGSPKPELFARWLSIGAFTPFFRNHTEIGSNDQEPWAFGENIENISKKIISQRYQLLPYIYSAFYESSQTGLPIAKSLAIDFTFDENIYKQEYQHQFLFGASLLVAPVESNTKISKVYLPEGIWYRFSTDEFFEGPKTVFAESPLNDLPVFVKAGSMLPMQSIVQNTLEKPSDTLNVHIYFGKKCSEFIYYEDDGITYEYENGKYFKRIFKFDPYLKNINIGKVEGTYESKFIKLNIILHNFSSVDQVKIDGKKMSLRSTDVKTNLKNIVIDNSNKETNISW